MIGNKHRFPAPEYSQTVLEQNFTDARDYFLHAMLQMHRAHAVMLFECGMLSRQELSAILTGLAKLDSAGLHEATYDGSVEDFFFFLEAELTKHCPAAIAGKLHTARSRNDIDITLYRMTMREELLALHQYIHAAATKVLQLAKQNHATLMPAHTHTQPAQPTTLGHYLCGVLECFLRDLVRMQHAYATVNRNPLGACAITTTGFPISRERTTELLGFAGLQVNSIGCIAATDYVAEAAGAVATSVVNLGKSTHDLLLWCTQEFGWLTLTDGFVQKSSIMPQKRNPVALEHTRILASRTLGQAQGLFTALHNTPFGDIVDSEDDLQPLIFQMFGDAKRAWRLYAAAVDAIEVNVARMEQASGANFLTVTELADTLVRTEKLSFHDAHTIVSAAVTEDRKDDSHERIVDAAIRIGKLQTPRAQLLQALDPRHFVEIREIAGGPGPKALAAQFVTSESALEAAGQWHAAMRQSLDVAAEKLAKACAV